MRTLKIILLTPLLLIAGIAIVVAGYYLGMLVGLLLFGGVVLLGILVVITFVVFCIWDTRNTRQKRKRR